ncbi:signal peptidase II [Bacillota bacterium]
MIFVFIILALMAADQASKYLISTELGINESVPLIDGIFHITYVQNFGAAFSILQGKQLFLIIVTFIAIAGISVYLLAKLKENHKMLSLALAFIAGGGYGNLMDRIRLGYVVDFMDFRVFPVFNIADICVCTGCGLLILYIFYFEKRINNKNKSISNDENPVKN